MNCKQVSTSVVCGKYILAFKVRITKQSYRQMLIIRRQGWGASEWFPTHCQEQPLVDKLGVVPGHHWVPNKQMAGVVIFMQENVYSAKKANEIGMPL